MNNENFDDFFNESNGVIFLEEIPHDMITFIREELIFNLVGGGTLGELTKGGELSLQHTSLNNPIKTHYEVRSNEAHTTFVIKDNTGSYYNVDVEFIMFFNRFGNARIDVCGCSQKTLTYDDLEEMNTRTDGYIKDMIKQVERRIVDSNIQINDIEKSITLDEKLLKRLNGEV